MLSPQKYLQESISCIKAEEIEISYLPKNLIQLQKRKQLIITKVKNGVDAYFENKKYLFITPKINNIKDTVGAGDTWFASYTAYYSQGDDWIFAARKATDFTYKFLL